MDILTPIQAILSALNDGDLKRIAQATGVSHGTIVKIKYKQTTDPRVRTAEKLYSYLCER